MRYKPESPRYFGVSIGLPERGEDTLNPNGVSSAALKMVNEWHWGRLASVRSVPGISNPASFHLSASGAFDCLGILRYVLIRNDPCAEKSLSRGLLVLILY